MTVYRQVPAHEASGWAQVWDPEQVRRVRFDPVGRLRRGLDPRQVYALLAHLAAVLEARDRQMRAVWAENDRLKAALRSWQSSHGPRPGDNRLGGAGAERPHATGSHPFPSLDVPARGRAAPDDRGRPQDPQHRREG